MFSSDGVNGNESKCINFFSISETVGASMLFMKATVEVGLPFACYLA